MTLPCRLICPFISKLQETTNRPIAFIDTCTCNRPYGSKTHPTQMMSRGIAHLCKTIGNWSRIWQIQFSSNHVTHMPTDTHAIHTVGLGWALDHSP